MSVQLSPKLISLDGNILEFYCPGCKMNHNVWTQTPNHLGSVWSWDGDVDLPTFSPSVLVKMSFKEPKLCHSFIKKGRIQFLGDCTHELKGQTVDLPDIPEDWL